MLLRSITYALVGLSLLPMGLIVVMSFTPDNYISFPPPSFSVQAYVDAMAKASFFVGFLRSLWIALVTAALATGLGTSVALGLVRYRFSGRELIQAIFMSPLILPQVVIGIALLLFYSRTGVASSAAALVLGHVIITIPYAIRLIGTSLFSFDTTLELAARNLGASPREAFFKITLPLLKPGILAGAIFAFITSFDNVTISVFLATPTFATFPVLVYDMLAQPIEPWLVALCSLVMLWTALLILVTQRIVGLQGLFGQELVGKT